MINVTFIRKAVVLSVLLFVSSVVTNNNNNKYYVCISAFSIPEISIHSIQHTTNMITHTTHVPDLLSVYKHTLIQYPLVTKMITGATLAVTGDAIAQSKQIKDNKTNTIVSYDQRRAVSFAAFDSTYRALQHVAFPLIVKECHGQYIMGILSTFLSANAVTNNIDNIHAAAAMEQTLVSQLFIVPFLYYPAFFTLTAAIQGLDMNAAIERAKENFIPLMKRNLLFWIPIQYIQFNYIPEEYQIPFLSCCGLLWTIILSIIAGSATKYSSSASTTAAAAAAATTTTTAMVINDDSTNVVLQYTTQTMNEELLRKQQQQQQPAGRNLVGSKV